MDVAGIRVETEEKDNHDLGLFQETEEIGSDQNPGLDLAPV